MDMVCKTVTQLKHNLYAVSKGDVELLMTTFANPYSLDKIYRLFCNLPLMMEKDREISNLAYCFILCFNFFFKQLWFLKICFVYEELSIVTEFSFA